MNDIELKEALEKRIAEKTGVNFNVSVITEHWDTCFAIELKLKRRSPYFDFIKSDNIAEKMELYTDSVLFHIIRDMEIILETIKENYNE